MARTSITNLLTLLADNTTGDITPAVMRTLVDTFTPAGGTIYLTSAAATDISAQGAYTLANGTTALLLANDFDMPQSMAIRYTAAQHMKAVVHCAFSVTCAGVNQTAAFRLAKSGASGATEAVATTIQRRINVGADVGAVSIMGTFELQQNDTISLYVANLSSSVNITIENMHLVVDSHPVE